jgi:hypothetical protein
VGLALVPTVIHTYLGATSNDGRVTSAISRSLLDLPSEPTSRRTTWVKEIFDSDDWIERSYGKPGVEPVVLFVARSYDPKRLYHHPELALASGIDWHNRGTKRLTSRPDIPVHVLQSGREAHTDLAVYSLLYGSRFIENPYLFQLRHAWESLFRSRKPMTLFFVHDPAATPHVPLEEACATQLLFAAIRSFLSQTPRSPQ